jgi:hypothetical protein
MTTRTTYLPPQFAIDTSIADNPIQQLRHIAYSGEAEVEPYTADGVRGERVILPTGAVLVVSGAIPGANDNGRVLQLRRGNGTDWSSGLSLAGPQRALDVTCP